MAPNAHFFFIEFLYKTQIKSNKRQKKRLLFGYKKTTKGVFLFLGSVGLGCCAEPWAELVLGTGHC
jgi:hypothetical protein